MGIHRFIQRQCDLLRPNRYALKSYLIDDGEYHPFAVICPGGGYGAVCSFCEGKPFAEKPSSLVTNINLSLLFILSKLRLPHVAATQSWISVMHKDKKIF